MTEAASAEGWCSACKKTLPAEAFFRDRAKKSGLASRCRPCQKTYHEAWRETHRAHTNRLEKARREIATPEVKAARTAQSVKWQAEKYANDPEWRARFLASQRRAYSRDPEKFKAQTRAWQLAHWDETLSIQARRRTQKRHPDAERIRPSVVFSRDDWVCHLCGETTEPDGPRARRPSMDHVVPLARGGEHTYDNVRCAHQVCNIRKGARLLTPVG